MHNRNIRVVHLLMVVVVVRAVVVHMHHRAVHHVVDRTISVVICVDAAVDEM
jgi:hypothetical protein